MLGDLHDGSFIKTYFSVLHLKTLDAASKPMTTVLGVKPALSGVTLRRAAAPISSIYLTSKQANKPVVPLQVRICTCCMIYKRSCFCATLFLQDRDIETGSDEPSLVAESTKQVSRGTSLASVDSKPSFKVAERVGSKPLAGMITLPFRKLYLIAKLHRLIITATVRNTIIAH